MKFALQINGSPCNGNAAQTSYRFTCAVLERGHTIVRVFFYYDGVYNALARQVSDKHDLTVSQQWTTLARKHQLDLVLCISAAQRRGLLHDTGSSPDSTLKPAWLAEGFRIGGLGQWVEALLMVDRFIIFRD